jgi:hypothetical protein
VVRTCGPVRGESCARIAGYAGGGLRRHLNTQPGGAWIDNGEQLRAGGYTAARHETALRHDAADRRGQSQPVVAAHAATHRVHLRPGHLEIVARLLQPALRNGARSVESLIAGHLTLQPLDARSRLRKAAILHGR